MRHIPLSRLSVRCGIFGRTVVQSLVRLQSVIAEGLAKIDGVMVVGSVKLSLASTNDC